MYIETDRKIHMHSVMSSIVFLSAEYVEFSKRNSI